MKDKRTPGEKLWHLFNLDRPVEAAFAWVLSFGLGYYIVYFEKVNSYLASLPGYLSDSLSLAGRVVASLLFIAVVCVVVGFALSVGWRAGKRFNKEDK